MDGVMMSRMLNVVPPCHQGMGDYACPLNPEAQERDRVGE